MSLLTTDNRESVEMYGYYESRIEALKRRIIDLEKENAELRRGRNNERDSHLGATEMGG